MFTSTEQVLWKPIIDSCTERHKARLSQFSQYREERYYANVWVQLLFYLNVHFSGVWLISSIVTLYYQYWNLSIIHRVLSILSLIIAAPIECLRLYLGYSGNLLDKIPDFAGFWILSVFIQTPLQIYLMTSEQILKYKISTIFQAIQCLLLFLQIASSFNAIRRVSRFRREQFRNEKVSFDMERRPNQIVASNNSAESD